MKKRLLKDAAMDKEDKAERKMDKEDAHVVSGPVLSEEANINSRDAKAERKKNRMKKRLLKEAAMADRRGVCYLSRIPPGMDHVKLRQIFLEYGELDRIYLSSENPAAQAQRKQTHGFRRQGFSEGWVEFMDKKIAKQVADMLNGEQMGGRKRSHFYYDIWNIKYLSKFKWDDLTEEIAYKTAVREQKLALEISTAKRERDFYLSKVDQSRALSCIEERMKKKQKIGDKIEKDVSPDKQVLNVGCRHRNFLQTQPVQEKATKAESGLSKHTLAKVFSASNK